MKPNLLIIANRPLHSAPRVIREIKALKHDYNITAVGITAPVEENVNFINIKNLKSNILIRILRHGLAFILTHSFLEVRLPARVKKLTKIIRETDAKYVILHETEFLPSLIKIKKKLGIKVILNAHEYYPGEFEENKKWVKRWQPYYINVYRKFLIDVDLFINVCDIIAAKCIDEFGKLSLVIPNAASYKNISPKDNRDQKVIKMIYHGNCNRGRKIEEMISLAVLLGDNYSLDLMFAHKADEYSEKIKELAETIGNVKIIPPVKFNEIIGRINEYDLGIYILAPDSFNNMAALPNKFYEYIQARLCIAISPTLEMKKITEMYNLGIVSDDFTAQSLAQKIMKLSRENIYQFKLNAEKAARDLSADHYNVIFLNAVKKL